MLETAEKKRISDFMWGVTDHPRQPSPRNPISKGDHDKIYNQGWNDAMAHLKAAGRI